VRFFALALLLSGCASLRTGWARVTWVEGKVAPVVSCTSRIGAEGDVELVCAPLTPFETDLLWKREKRRTTQGDL